MSSNQRSTHSSSPSSATTSHFLIITIFTTFGLLTVVALSVWAIRRRRHYDSLQSPIRWKSAITPKYSMNIKGLGGLKNSPSSLSSPFSSDSSQCSPLEPTQNTIPPDEIIQRIDPLQLGDERGFIEFDLHFDNVSSSLQINVECCRDLPEIAITSNGQCLLDPYVKLQLLPEKQHRMKTRVVRATRNPEYHESFSLYGVDQSYLDVASLHFVVIAFDRYSRDAVLAEAVYPLKDADLMNKPYEKVELKLAGRGCDLGNDRGQVLISLCYQPATCRVTAVILKARNLPRFDITGLADPYVNLFMVFDGKRVCKKRSHVKKRTLSPVYNESFVFELPSSKQRDLDATEFEVVVMDWNRITKDEVLGRCIIGSNGDHWMNVRSNPRRQIAEWHQLTP